MIEELRERYQRAKLWLVLRKWHLLVRARMLWTRLTGRK